MKTDQTVAYGAAGFAIYKNFYSSKDLERLKAYLDRKNAFDFQQTRLNEIEFITHISKAKESLFQRLSDLAAPCIGEKVMPLSAVILDKTRSDNWELDWHQDLRITVPQKFDTPGFQQWSGEPGLWQVMPPAYILQKCLIVRIHLDDCDESNGALMVAPGTHGMGIINQDLVRATTMGYPICQCRLSAGDVMLMSPLLIHKSPVSHSDRSRRIIHITYQAAGLNEKVQ